MSLHTGGFGHTLSLLIAGAGAAVPPVVAEGPPDDVGRLLLIGLGVLAGTVARAPYWFTERGDFLRRVCLTDISGMGVLVMAAMAAASYLEMGDWTAAGAIAVLTSFGVPLLRAMALDWFKSRVNATRPGDQP